jgi:VWFA-related protein
VDVVATDRSGKQISDLTADDFEITDEGKRQTVAAFKLVSSDGGSETGELLPTSSDAVEEIDSSPDDVRLFALFLDDFHVSARWSGVAREQLARFVEKSLGPADLVALMHPLTPINSVRLARNRTAVATEIRGFDGVRGTNAGDSDPRRGSITTIRRDASLTALEALIKRLGSLKEGRKTLMLVTEGYGSNAELLGRLKDIGDLASRNNTAIYPVYARIAGPNFADDVSVNGETMRVLAERSGGRMIFDATKDSGEYRRRVPTSGRPDSQLVEAMDQVIVDASGYYLLGYSAADAVPDGEFHRIVVKTKRPGVELRYRKGYLSLKPGEAPRPVMTSVPAATPVETARAFDNVSRDRMVYTWIGMSRGDDDTKTHITLAWDPVAAQPGAASPSREDTRPARLTLKASGPDNVTYYEGKTSDAAGAIFGSSASFDVPPGRMQLRLSVENAAGQVLDSDVQNVLVADLSAASAAASALMSTPAIYRSRSASEWRLLAAGAGPSPAAGREFNRTDRLLIRVTTYGEAEGRTTLTTTLLNRAGQQLTTLQAAASQAPGMPPETWDIDLPLANLARGEYGVKISATAADKTATETVAFRVN